MVICSMGTDNSLNQRNSLCLVEQVKDKKTGCVGVIIQSNEEELREEMKAIFAGTDVVYDFIHVKREEALVSNGFQKDLQAIAVFGDKSCFENKEVKTFYNCTFKEAIHSIITDIVCVKSAVLYTFSEAYQALDLDPIGTLARKKISIDYLAKKKLLVPVSDRISKKLRS
jgi:hypothetical protein